MQHSQRLDQRLHMLREEVRTMTQEKEREERVWRERLQRCQRQLKAKEEEMSRQAQYFENFKTQLQHKLSLAWESEQSLQNRIFTLEKQLLDMTVSAATGMATIRAVRITAGTVQCLGEQERLSSMRGEGEGEEETKEERRKQWQPSVGTGREERQESDEGKTENDVEGGRNSDTKQSSNEARLQGFIVSLQEDLRVLLEREEERITERRGLMEQLQEAQESSHFLNCQVDEMKAEIDQLKLSDSSLLEEVEQLREENQRLQQVLRDSANHTPSQPSACLNPGNSTPNSSPAVNSVNSNTFSYTTATGHSSVACLGEAYSSAVARVHHQATAEGTESNTEHYSSALKLKMPPKNNPLNSFYRGSEPSTNFKSFSLTTESLDEFKLGNWCSAGILNLEESPSEESDALREAYRSLGLGGDLRALQEQRDDMEVVLQRTQNQLKEMAEENVQLKLELRKQAEEKEVETEQSSSREKINTPFTFDGNDHLRSSPTQDETILPLAQDDPTQALNQENRAMAERIQELLAHIELKEVDMTKQQTQLMERISRLEEDQVRLEQENQEQGCLISELTKKTEDDLNTIMELQQKLVQGEEVAHLMFNQETDTLKADSVSGSQHNNHCDSLKNSSQNHPHVGSLTEQVAQLTNSVQNLKTEQEGLTKYISSLREQQREVALSIQVQTEEKQQLTRTIWRLKEEKDYIFKALADLKQEKEQLSRAVCGLRNEKEHFVRSMNGLNQEKEQLNKSLSALERDKGAIMESLSSGKEERDETLKSLQSLRTESDQVSQTVLNLKQERDNLTNSLKCLKEQRDQEQISFSLMEDHDRLMKTVSSLKEEKGRSEHSVSCLKEEEKQIMLVIQGLREERNSLQALCIQKQTEEGNQKQQLLNPSSADLTKKTEIPAETADYATQRFQSNNHRRNLMQQEENDLMREIEALGAELKRSQEEMDKSRAEIKRLHGELCHSEEKREEAEKKATQAAEKVMKLTDVENQMEETRKENYNLITQVKELQNKVTGLLREKTDALSLKAQIEEQYKILTSQLNAKQTVALEELNSEYIALKRGQGSRDDISTVLVSLRARYNDIRAKYDALLKRKSETELDIPPLKAKLSCLVVKCQERNSLLYQMMKILQRQGFVAPHLTQQVEHLLSDAALQDYTAAFASESITKTRDYTSGFTPVFISKFKGCTSEFIPDWTSPVVSTSVKKQQQTGVTPEAGRGKEIYRVSTESLTNHQDCSSEFTPVATGSIKKDASSSVPSSPVLEPASIQESSSAVPPNESEITSTAPLSPSASGPSQAASKAEKSEFHYLDVTKEKCSLYPTSLTASLLSPTIYSFASPRRRLSSPEKILNLQEQLQKTLRSSFEAPESRGRGQQPRRSLSLSAPTDLNKASQTKKLSLSPSPPQINSVPVTTAFSQAAHTPVVTTKPTATNKSPTLFDAVACRSAYATFSPSVFTNHHLKAATTKTTPALSSSSNFLSSTLVTTKSISSSGTNVTLYPEMTKKITAISDVACSTHKASIQSATTFDSDVTNPKATPSDATAPNISTAPKVISFNMTSKIDGASPEIAQSYQLSHCSPERSDKSTAHLGKIKAARPKPEAPAEVRSVEVIKTVGQSSLMIGWERPQLDELGCSNGTFVYGYRVYVDGDFHKSVMSSACTKCILENIDLSVPAHISVQTLGSNGLSSDSVHTMYRTSVGSEPQ
ncbi:protein lava lamp-like [Archocentrus centrarchus]|uniref:protein lava lamp-like n=1 Tax=Archocentrus centrarchus TaxID=63155 RepID=UPI0011E9D178|nr:protein lava lamp-like [Archocentrus centrarchus]